MLIFPNAKINLGLHILRKRQDNYHDIHTVMVPVRNLSDALEFVPASGKDQFHMSGLVVPGESSENICIKALALLRESFEIPPLRIYLHKHIPMGAGLGGGSADGAFFLTALNDHFKLGLKTAELENFAARLGSDCAFFIRNEPAISEGRGEVLRPIGLNLSGKALILVHLGLHISTAKAYANMQPEAGRPSLAAALAQEPMNHWKQLITNDFEAYAFQKFPVLKQVKEMLYKQGAEFAAMTGSGSAVYGIFEADVLERLSAKMTEELKSAFGASAFVHHASI